jgi:hypothetical protein
MGRSFLLVCVIYFPLLGGHVSGRDNAYALPSDGNDQEKRSPAVSLAKHVKPDLARCLAGLPTNDAGQVKEYLFAFGLSDLVCNPVLVRVSFVPFKANNISEIRSIRHN